MIKIEWNDVQTPIFISIWIVFVVIIKIIFHASEKLVIIFPDSALLIIAGFSVGTVLDWILPAHDIYLDPDLFFIYLLPPIVLEAGFFLPSEIFFRNIGTILIFAVVGTLWNIISIAGILYLFSSFYTMEITFLNLTLFSTLISAVDPVAVLSVFTEVRVNELLYICVFGESLLNDAVTIVLYHALTDMNFIGGAHLELTDFVRASGSFFLVSLGGLLIGTLFALLAGLGTKAARKLPVVQPLICLLLPYLSYLLAEMFHFSGILSIVACGLLMKSYIKANMSDEPRVTVKYFLKTISSSVGSCHFYFPGSINVFQEPQLGCCVYPCDCSFLSILSLCEFKKLALIFWDSYVTENVLKKSGFLINSSLHMEARLRGAICYGLAMTLDKTTVPAKDTLVSTTVVVICFTVFIQGMSIKPLVKFLRVKTKESTQSAVTSFIFTNAQEDLLAGIEAIAGIRGKHYTRRLILQLDREYIQPFLTHKENLRGDNLIEQYGELSALAEKERQAEAKNKTSMLLANF
ncbi:Sodium/hydrogen exchanger [Aphelenchoides bicaudatus]|nr:Sodium/hydrogen exchanger [Aphelenchoides bicaudatus]